MSRTGTRFTVDIGDFDTETFAVVNFHLIQHYSALFTLDLHAISDDIHLKATELLELNVTLTLWQNNTAQRHITGLVARIERGEYDGHKMNYYLRVHPPFWRSSLRENFRHFQQQDIQSIIQHLLDDNRVMQTAYLLGEPHPAREFCVQYGETDFGFLCRLLAEEGIFFYEEHAREGKDQPLVFCDKVYYLPEAFPLPFNPEPRTTETECISQFRHSAQIRPAYVISKDYTFKYPDWPGRFRHNAASLNGQRNQYEVMDYPGRFKDEQHGRDFTRYQMEGWRNDAEIARGCSNSPKLWPGTRFTLTDHPADDLNREWQVIASELHGEQPQAVPGSRGQGTTLVNTFQAIPADKTWRPTPQPKPKVDGPQPAVVTGPEGEEIFCDEHGRVRVKFLWDRYHKQDENSSCWIRVSQPWAGTGFGHLAIPRVGQEVIVDFLNGDPDQPLIMGRTYHEKNRSPGDLPGTKTQTTIRTQTYRGEGFNELRFEDATNREQVYMHAQKDHVTEILHDESHTIGNNRAKSVGVDQQETIGQDKKTDVGRDHYETIGRNSVVRVVQDQEIEVDRNRTLVVNSSERKKIFADSLDDIGGNKTVVIQGVKDETVNTKIFSQTNKYIMHAGERLVIAGPGGSLTIDGGGVTIKAKKLQILTPAMDIRGGGVDQVEALTAMVNEGKPFCEICAKARQAEEEDGKK